MVIFIDEDTMTREEYELGDTIPEELEGEETEDEKERI